MADLSLVAMFDEVRGTTLRVLEGVDDVASRWHPPGLSNSILWHAGHCYVVTEWITMQSLGRSPESPDRWFDLFGWDSQPGLTPSDQYPPLKVVIHQLQGQRTRLRTILASISEEELARPSAEWPDRSARHMILHGFQDEASHKGEMWLLRKLQGKA